MITLFWFYINPSIPLRYVVYHFELIQTSAAAFLVLMKRVVRVERLSGSENGSGQEVSGKGEKLMGVAFIER